MKYQTWLLRVLSLEAGVNGNGKPELAEGNSHAIKAIDWAEDDNLEK
jgi:hypothetical protein